MTKVKNACLIFIALIVIPGINLFSQVTHQQLKSDSLFIDSLYLRGLIYDKNQKPPEIVFSNKKAADFLNRMYNPEYWNDIYNPFRKSIGQLIFFATNPPYDSTQHFLNGFPYDSLKVSWDKFYKWDTLRFKIPVVSPPEFNISSDTMPVIDTSLISLERVTFAKDSLVSDTVSNFREQTGKNLVKPSVGWKDTLILVIADTLNKVSLPGSMLPLKYYSHPYQGDSLIAAIGTLLEYLTVRDSSIVNFTGVSKVTTPVWINSRADRMVRYWLRNEFDDSVTVWIGNPERNTIGLYLEKGVNFRRPMRQGNISDARIDLEKITTTELRKSQKIVTKVHLWKYRSEMSSILSQAALSNWVKGGESSISTSIDITGYADYNNPYLKVTSNNFARLKYGLISTEEKGIRKNLDLLETNSKLNHKAFGKFDFSAIMLFKTQVARGYNYPNDSVPVSKFMNPAILTIGLGLDYKPDKKTSINLSPISYKGTFVTDTLVIDQTKYGIDKDRKSKNELGLSFMITNEKRLFKKVTVTNRFQLFTNYVYKPFNFDVDWEMIAIANINWFTDVRLNTHLIFDNDTKTPVLGEDNKPVLLPNGQVKKTARAQFKELLGLTFVFRF